MQPTMLRNDGALLKTLRLHNPPKKIKQKTKTYIHIYIKKKTKNQAGSDIDDLNVLEQVRQPTGKGEDEKRLTMLSRTCIETIVQGPERKFPKGKLLRRSLEVLTVLSLLIV